MTVRRGFTLIELLVVLGILVLLGSIGAAAFASSGRTSRFAGAEQLITASLRQARYTARATGQAVLIYIDKDSGTISGISRYPLWQTTCETTLEPFRSGDPLETFHAAFGRTGGAFNRPVGTPATTAGAYTFFDPAGAGDLRNRARQLTPNRSGTTTGFQLTCAARLPMLNGAAQWMPLVAIDGGAGTAIPASDGGGTASYAGLLMHRREMPMYGSATPPTFSTAPNLNRPCWDLVGWIVVGGLVEAISSVDHAIDPGTIGPALTNDPDKAARRIGYAGGTWEEVSLLLSGQVLELYRDGLLVAQRTLTAPPRVDGHGQVHRLVLGSLSLASGLAGRLGTATASDLHLPPEGSIDDVSLVRLGSDQPRNLPNGIVPWQTYQLLVRPDGRLSSLPVAGVTALPAGLPAQAAPVRLVFTGTQNERDDYAIIDLGADTGAIRSSQITLGKTAP